MATPIDSLKSAAGQPGEGLKNLLNLLQGASAARSSPSAGQAPQIAAELAYKLAQASAQATDPALLKVCVTGLLEALEGINKSLARKEK